MTTEPIDRLWWFRPYRGQYWHAFIGRLPAVRVLTLCDEICVLSGGYGLRATVPTGSLPCLTCRGFATQAVRDRLAREQEAP